MVLQKERAADSAALVYFLITEGIVSNEK